MEAGRIHWHARRPGQAATALERSARAYGQITDLRGQAVADYHRGIVLFESGRHHDAIALTHDALRRASTLGNTALECDLLTNLGEMHRLIAHDEHALDFFERAQRLADRQGDPHNIAVLATNIAALYNHRGDPGAALASCATALRLFQALGDRRNEIDTLLQMAEALRQTQQFDHALIQVTRAAELADQVHDPLRRSRVQLAEGHVHRDRGLHQHAADCYTAALTHAKQAQAPLDQAHAHRALAQMFTDLGDEQAARRHHEEAHHLHPAPDPGDP